MMKPQLALLKAICFAFLIVLPTTAFAVPPGPTVEWVRQFGTSGSEWSATVSADPLGNVFVGGATSGTFSGPTIPSYSVFIRKYDASGTAIWTRQIAPQEINGIGFVAADGFGNVYAGGDTEGNVAAPLVGGTDYFLRKYDNAGNVLWTRQAGSLSYDYVQKAATDSLGNVYLTGFTGYDLGGPALGGYDSFLIKYDPLGNKLWSRNIGTSDNDYGRGVATDPLGNVYVTGSTDGSFAAPWAGSDDIFVAKYDSTGNQLWKKQLGTPSSDIGYDVAADKFGHVYLSAYTEGTMAPGAPGFGDVVVAQFDSAGNQNWIRQFGTPQTDISFRATSDQMGNYFVEGHTTGSLGGPANGSYDVFAVKFLPDGTQGWSYQIGSSGFDLGYGISTDGLGKVYLSGFVEGVVGASSAGGYDAFVVKLNDPLFVPEPATLTYVSAIALAGLSRRRRMI
jgi:hypothetical protein